MYPLPATKPKKDPNNPGIGTLGATPTPAIASPTPPIARPKPTPLQQQAAGTQAAYGASVGRAATAQRQAQGIQIPAPIIREGHGTVSAIAQPGTNAATTALGTLGGIQRQEADKQAAMIPTFNQQAAGLRQQADVDRAATAAQGANSLLRGVGAAPIAAPVAQPSPAARPSAGVASPHVAFAGVDAEPAGMFRKPATSPTETGLRTPAAAPAAVLRPGDLNTFTGGNGRSVAVPAMSSPTTGSVESQSFGSSVPIARPTFTPLTAAAKASTYGLPVNDPRLNDQTAPIQQPGQITLNPQGNSDTFNAREDREARQKLASDLDSQRFCQELVQQHGGRQGRAATAALGDIAHEQANLAGAGERLSAEALQGRANRANTFDIASLNNQGETNRTQMGADVAREGNQLGYRQGMAQVGASLIAKPELKQDDSGNYFNVTGGKADRVVDAEGNPVRGQLPAIANPGAITPALQYETASKQLTSLLNNPPVYPEQQATYDQSVATLRGQIASLTTGAPPGMVLVGTKGGKPVYRDQSGNFHVKE